MMDAYVLFGISYVITGISIIACIMAYILLPVVIRSVFKVDDEESEEE